MRHLCLVLAVLLLLPLPLCFRTARAGDDPVPEGMTPKQVKACRTRLRSRAVDWWGRRKKLATVCPQCKGSGQVRWRRGRRRVLVACPKCDGHKLYVGKDEYRRCYYELRSPAFRLQPGIRARVAQEYMAACAGNPFPVIVKRYKIEDVEIVDATHGLVHVVQNKDSVARPQRWIRASERGKRPTWFFYDAEADGPWPSDAPPEAAAVPAPLEPDVPVPAVPVPRPPVEVPPQPAPTPPADTVDRAGREESAKLFETWTDERNDYLARVIRIELGIEEVEGHEERVAQSRKFLAEIKGWMAEEETVYGRVQADVEDRGLGVSLDDRVKMSTNHFKTHRRLQIIEKILVSVVPDLGD